MTLCGRPSTGLNLSDRSVDDEEGWPAFTFAPTGDPLVVRRDDGVRFELRPEAHHVFSELRRRGSLVGVLSYNYEGNVRRVVDAFGLVSLVDYIIAEWHSNKDRMLEKMIASARHDGHVLSDCDAILIDDDPREIYREQCKRMGYGFSRFGVDIHSLDEVLNLV